MPQVRSLLTTGRTVRPLLSALTVGIALFGCSNAPAVTTTSPTTTSTTVVATTRVEVPLQLPSTTTTTVVTTESLPTGSSLVGHASADVEIFDSPELAAPSYVLKPATSLGSPRVFLVESGPVDGWVEVSLPIRPNGSTGWVRAGALDLAVLDYAIFVDLSDRLLRLEQSEEVVLETEVAVGSPHNPTPTGSYFVTDIVELADPGGPWGPFALGLSAFSDTITEFNGGNGIIGIHGTNRPASIGEPVSLGCVRVPNEIAALLADLVKLGTPVEIAA
jgi:lipoprotein-anchoring transpeptidase ErfK/SrfK